MDVNGWDIWKCVDDVVVSDASSMVDKEEERGKRKDKREGRNSE
jgi:hypothetical protein